MTSGYWEDEFDLEFQTRICEGIDNIDNIDRHYEKTLIEQYKAKQKSNLLNPGNIQFGNQIPNRESQQLNRGMNEKKNTKAAGRMNPDHSSTIGNPKIGDSTLLHFSTTYDNTNSSAFTYPDESIDSIDELNLNQNLVNIDTMLFPENEVYFKILDLFSILSEKTNELLATKYNTFNSNANEGSSNNATVDENNYSGAQSPAGHGRNRMNYDIERIYEISNLSTLRYGEQEDFKFHPKGLKIDPNDDVNQQFLKKYSSKILTANCMTYICTLDLFLNKFEKKFSWILNNLDMSSAFFYELETEQLQILLYYLDNNTSRTTVFEVIDHTFDLLLFVKKQILDLSASFLNQLNSNNNASNQLLFSSLA